MLKKLTKTQVKAELKKLATGEKLKVWFCPSNCYPNPNHPFNCAIDFELVRDGEYNESLQSEQDLESLINSFTYYNTCSERGRRVHYYIAE